ncbi:MAG: MarR family transcriptional regulator [Erythrobacter sp.]
MKNPKHSDLNEDSAFQNSRDGDGLGPVADQLAAIAEQLRSSGHSGQSHARPAQNGAGSASSSPDRTSTAATEIETHRAAPSNSRHKYTKLARNAYEVRRIRGRIFGQPELFGEPAWDILLDLYVAHADGKRVSVSSACIGSASPPTTGLRWLGILSDQGLVLREHDPEDQRRVLVRLTDAGIDAMDQYFADASKRQAAL